MPLRYFTPTPAYPDAGFAAADRWYIGGHVYIVDEAEQADIAAAGYEQWLGDEVTGYGYDLYGSNLYGVEQSL